MEVPITIGPRPEGLESQVDAPTSLEVCSSVGSIAVPRDSRNEFENANKSWLVTGRVNPGEIGPGCQLNCAYCNQQSFDVSDKNEKLAGYISVNDGGTALNTRLMVGNRIERMISPDQLVSELVQKPSYDRNGWLLLENYNDPGTNWRQTCRLIDLLVTQGHEGPMTFITKMGIPEKYAAELGALREKGAKLTGIVTYTGLPQAIEPAPVAPRIETLRRLQRAGIPTIVSMRPLIEGINLSEESIVKVLSETRGFTDYYIAGGLFVFDEWTPEVFARAGYPLGERYTSANYDIAKVAPEALDKLVQRVADKNGIEVTVLPHTTCAIATVMTTKYEAPHADRLAHWVGHNNPGTVFDTHCTGCPVEQQAACKQVGERNPEEIMGYCKNCPL